MLRKALINLSYPVLLLLTFDRCAYNDTSVEVDCDASSLGIELISKENAGDCKAIDGSITVTATGGVEPYNFSINGGEYQTDNTFKDLGAGTYVLRVKDMHNCWRSMDVTLESDSDLAASTSTTPDNQCSTDNGSITVTASGGTAPYQYQLNSQGYVSGPTFTGLKNGPHTVIVKDSRDCQTTLGVVVARGNSGISFATQIKNILDTNCNLSGCHGSGTGVRDWTNFNNVKSNASNIKTRTANRTMPPGTPLAQSEIDLIGCWVDDGAPNN